MMDGFSGEVQDFIFKLSGPVVKDGLKSSCCSFADSIAFFVVLINKAEILKESFYQLFGQWASDEAGQVGVGLYVFFFLGEGSPKLHGQPANILILRVLN